MQNEVAVEDGDIVRWASFGIASHSRKMNKNCPCIGYATAQSIRSLGYELEGITIGFDSWQYPFA
jgi:hypothetical protein